MKNQTSHTKLQTNEPNSITHIYLEQFEKVSSLHTSLFTWKAPK